MSTNETSIDKAFYSSEYGTTSNRPYVVVSYTENTGGLNYTSKDVDEGSTFQLTWSGVSSGITWTSSNTSVATVNSSGKVTGVKAGTATITASASGYTSVRCTVYVTIADGIYYIKNNLSGYYLGIPSSAVSSGNMATQQTKVTSDPSRFAQLWRVLYISSGYYSIRPVHKPDSALNLTTTFVDIWETGITNTLASVADSRRWTITYSQGGYVFKNSTNDSAMVPTSLSTAVNTTITVGTLTTSAAYRWSFETPAAISNQMLLYDNNTKTYSSNIVRYIAPGETLTLTQLGLHATFVSSGTMSQNLVWSSANSNRVSINAATGTITGVNPGGSTTITVSQRSGGNIYSKSYTIYVTQLPEGTYYIRNKSTGRYVEINNQTMSSGSTIVQWDYHSGNSEKWIFTHMGDGTYSIRSANSTANFYLGVANNSTANNEPIILRTGSVVDEMKWKITLSPNGAYYLTLITGEEDGLIFAPDLGNYNVSNHNGIPLIMRHFEAGENDRGEWELSSSINIGLSTDNYSLDSTCASRSSSIYAITFYNNLLPTAADSPTQITHKYNANLTKTASKNDFYVNGAISNDIDFMIYIGHGHKADNSKGNHLHYSCSPSGAAVSTGHCEDEVYNAYTSEMSFGSNTSKLRWVWLYTCNFLTSKTQLAESLVTDNMLKEMMNGAHIVMGYGSQSYLCDPMAQVFSEYLRLGYPIIDAYFMAGNVGEAPYASDNHIQKILYVPQARYETIYSPSVNYQYDTTDVLIITNYIDDNYSAE